MSKAKTSISRIAGLSALILLLGGLGLGLTALRKTTNLKTEASNTKPVCEDFKSIQIESCGKLGWMGQTNKCKTEKRNVQLNLDSSGAKQMRFKEINPKTTCALTDASGWTDWENYAVKKDFKLSGGYGNKKVCVTFKNDLGESKCGANIKHVGEKLPKQGGSSKLCSSKGNSSIVCNGRKVGEDVGPCTCVYSSLGGSDCMCTKKEEGNSPDSKDDYEGIHASKYKYYTENCSSDNGAEPLGGPEHYSSFKLCRSAIAPIIKTGTEYMNNGGLFKYAQGKCMPLSSGHSYDWTCFCDCTNASCSNCN